MANKVFNNERPSSIRPESVFYGKIRSGEPLPKPSFNTGNNKNNNIDYGNKWTQKISNSNTTSAVSPKNGIMYR